MQCLRTYLNSMPAAEQVVFAAKCGTSVGYLRKALSVGQLLGAELCARLDVQSGGAVRRWDLRPEDWHRIWPELIETDGAPQLHAPAETD